MKALFSCEKLVYGSLLLAIATLVFTFYTKNLELLIFSLFVLLLSFPIIYGCFLNLKLKIENESENARERLANQILEIARTTLPHLRQGLNIGTASKVVEIIYESTDADAVAITDKRKVLAFRGRGEEHHRTGQKIMTQATRKVLNEGKSKVILNKEDIGCPEPDCPLSSAIIVPLKRGKQNIATLKLYYRDPKKVTRSSIALAEGLAHLLEVQLELSEIAKLEFLACEAELKALQSQINPHFFFNVLNTAVFYCRRNPMEARKILLNFSNFFRATIEHGEEPLISLDSELTLIRNYVELEASRYGENLIFNNLVSDEAKKWKIPPFTLQPIVENSIQHAFVPGKKLVINIRDYSTQDIRIVEVEDNGKGIPEEMLPTVLIRKKGYGLGIGLSLVHERLKLLYGEEYGLSIESKPGKGTKVRIIMPARDSMSILNRLPEK